MATLTLDRKTLEKEIKLTSEVVDKIMMLGIPIEVGENEVVIEVLPNRPDMLSMQGFLRAVRAGLGKETGLKKYKISPAERDHKIIVDKSVERVRPFSMAAIIKGVEFTDEKIKEIMQWQEKIHATVGRNRKKVALGYYVLNKIKFPIRYITKNPKEIVFEPLDMPERMDAIRILSRHPCGREYGNQLDGITKFPVYYDANDEVLSMPPIINSNNSGKITPGTSDILIECSGNNLETLKKVVSMAVVDLIDMGGKAYAVNVVYGNKSEQIDLTPETIKISLENTNKLLGLSLKEKDLEKLLPKAGYDYNKGQVSIPAWRSDIIHEVDVIEDIAIAYGYENLQPEIPKVATIGEESKESKIGRKIAEIIAGLDYLETSSYHLIKDDEVLKGKLKETDKIELENSKTEYKILRPNLTIPALRIFSENKDNEYPQNIFEIGTTFTKDSRNKTETGIIESNHLLIASSPNNFTELKRVLDYLAKMLDIQYTLKESAVTNLIEGRAADILIDNMKVGFIGEVHPETLGDWNIKMPISLIEISLEEIYKKIN